MNRNIIITAFCAFAAFTGCDTVAELTFQDEQLIEAIPQGLVSKTCGAAEVEGTDAIFRFSVLTSLNQRMTPGRRYAALGDILEPGENFKAEDVMFSDGWFFVVGDDGLDMTCESESECPEGASCQSPETMGLSQYYYAPSSFCVYSTTIKVSSTPRFTHYRTKVSDNEYALSSRQDGRSFAFVIDNSATMDGSTESGVPNIEKASDPWEYRKVGLNQFMDGLETTDETSPRFEFSAHFANGTGTTGVFDASSPWMRTISAWESTVMRQYPTPSGYSPIWEAASASINKLIDSSSALYGKSMIAITDGEPNTSTDESFESFRKSMTSMPNMPLHWLELTRGQKHRRYADVVNMGCGTHYIFDNPVFFSKIMRNIAMNSESHWDVDLDFSAQLPENLTYRLATTLVAKIGNTAVTFEAQRSLEENETIDYRLVYSR